MISTNFRTLPQILSYGGGLDSWAMLLEAVRRDDKPEVVVFCDVTDKARTDPGEWPGTYRHIEQVVIPFCRKHGIRFEWIDTERYPVREARSLFAWMAARNQVPVAGNTRICTRIAKVERFEAWLDDTYGDQQVCVWIGFEAGEEKRADKDPNAGKPSARRRNRFPLIEWGLCRCGCEEVARASGLPIPRKSACVYCPYGSRCDWQNFAREIPEQFAQVVKLEADKPLTKNGEKIAIMGFGKKRKDGTRNIQLLDEWVTRPGRPGKPKVCDHCGQIRATKETRSDWLEDGDAEVLQALRDDRSEATEDPRAETDLANDVTANHEDAMNAYNADRIVTLNLGMGRDSLTMLCLLIEHQLVVDGAEIGPDDIDAVVFADTGAEWQHTTALLPAVRDLCFEHGLRFLMLRKPAANGPRGWKRFLEDKAAGRTWKGTELLPWQNPRLDIEGRAGTGFYHRRPPIFDDYRSRQTVVSLGKGDCTDNHKIQVIRRLIDDLAVERFGVNNRQWAHAKATVKRPPHVTLIGIAADEASRVKESGRSPKFITERYPLIEMGISKDDEQVVLDRHGLGHARKSGCYGCPFQPASWYWVVRETQPSRWAELLEYERVALAHNPKMFVTGRKPLEQFVSDWRAKHPDATIDAVLDKSYGRGCEAIKAIRAEQKAEARAEAETVGRAEPDAHEVDACPHCGEDWFLSTATHWMLDVRTDIERPDCHVTCQPCCETIADIIATEGYEAATGRTVETVVRQITGHDVLEVTGDGDGAVVCRLQIDNPTRDTGKTDRHGHAKAVSVPGWQTRVFDLVDEHHEHHDQPNGWKFGIAIFNGNIRVGVAVVARPSSRMLQQAQPHTLEVTRVCVWGHPALRKNACSKLYAAAAKQSRALGYDRLVTYTIHGEESGHSVRSAGWVPTNVSSGGSWDREGRKREDKAPTGRKVRWEKGLTKKTRKAVAAAQIELAA